MKVNSAATSLACVGDGNGHRLTYRCAPPGSGKRVALYRDEDGTLNSEDALIMGRAETGIQPMNLNEAQSQMSWFRLKAMGTIAKLHKNPMAPSRTLITTRRLMRNVDR